MRLQFILVLSRTSRGKMFSLNSVISFNCINHFLFDLYSFVYVFYFRFYIRKKCFYFYIILFIYNSLFLLLSSLVNIFLVLNTGKVSWDREREREGGMIVYDSIRTLKSLWEVEIEVICALVNLWRLYDCLFKHVILILIIFY